jgi:large subunit ribosomal protein L4
MALSDKVANNNLIALDKLEITEFKTKMFNGILDNLIKQKNKKAKKQSILVINDKKDEKTKYSARNLQGIKLINLDNINIVDLLKYKNLILTVDAVNKLEEKYK